LPKLHINCVKAACLFHTQQAAFLLFSGQKERLNMDTNDINDLLLMLLDDDLFWEPQEQTNDKQQCGDTSNPIPVI
jgi:hypothetical protein